MVGTATAREMHSRGMLVEDLTFIEPSYNLFESSPAKSYDSLTKVGANSIDLWPVLSKEVNRVFDYTN